MKKEITIIELLNKIANGEEVPEKIKYKDTEYIFSDGVQDYLECNKYDFDLLGYCFCNYRTRDFINDKVEIIEDNEDNDIRKPAHFSMNLLQVINQQCKELGVVR